MALFEKFKKPRLEAVIAALGNPGREYAKNRHNAGFLCADQLCENAGVALKRAKFSALVTELTLKGHRTLLLLPQTYMNLSGKSVWEAMSFYRLPPEKLIVLVDDIHLPCGMIRVRTHGSAGGHKGLKSISEALHSEAYTRVRIGVGAPQSAEQQSDFVLGDFTKSEQEKVTASFACAEDALRLILDGNTAEAMNRYNHKAPPNES